MLQIMGEIRKYKELFGSPLVAKSLHDEWEMILALLQKYPHHSIHASVCNTISLTFRREQFTALQHYINSGARQHTGTQRT